MRFLLFVPSAFIVLAVFMNDTVVQATPLGFTLNDSGASTSGTTSIQATGSSGSGGTGNAAFSNYESAVNQNAASSGPQAQVNFNNLNQNTTSTSGEPLLGGLSSNNQTSAFGQ